MTPTEKISEDISSSAISGLLHIVPRRVVELKPDPNNTRIHSKKQLRQIAESIRLFGFNVPILVDAASRVIAGHGRLEAAKLLGLTEVPTICIAHLSEAQVRAFQIADNKLTENAEWNEQLLAAQLKALCEAELDFNVEVTGFEMGDIDVLIEGAMPAAAEAPDEVLGELANAVPVTQSGDLWQLGPHRILCGNALETASYGSVMNGQLASMVFADPPYNVPVNGHTGGLGRVQHREFQMASGEMSGAEYTGFLTNSARHASEHSRDGSLHYVCMDWRHLPELLAAGAPAYDQLLNVCVWTKNNGGMGSFYRSQHELVFVYKKGSAAHRNNVQLGQYGRYRSNVWEYPGANSFSRSSPEGNLLALHPTVKPVELVADAILDCTARGEIVLDPFLGSGTTVIAAERTGRVCCGMEIDPLYVDTAVRRWQRYTGHSAIDAAGRSFAEREQEIRQ